MSEVIFFDIDYALNSQQSKLAIIDKDNPGKILMRIKNTDEPFLNYTWKKYNLKVDYNDNTFWLNPSIFKSILRISKELKLNRIGITYRDYTPNEVLEQEVLNLNFLINNLYEIKDSSIHSVLLTSFDKNKYSSIVEKIKNIIKNKLRLSIFKAYYINNVNYTLNDDIITSRKSKILLEHLTGFKIKNDAFIDLKQNEYNFIKIYDNNDKNILAYRNLQIIFDEIYKNTEETIREEIKIKFKYSKKLLSTYLITTNELKPFIITHNLIKLP